MNTSTRLRIACNLYTKVNQNDINAAETRTVCSNDPVVQLDVPVEDALRMYKLDCPQHL